MIQKSEVNFALSDLQGRKPSEGAGPLASWLVVYLTGIVILVLQLKELRARRGQVTGPRSHDSLQDTRVASKFNK